MTLHENGRADVVSVSPGHVASSKEEPLTETIIPDCPRCAAERAQSRGLADVIVEQEDVIRAVRSYADECQRRAGAMIDAATVAASLAPIISGRATRPDVQLAARLSLLERAIEDDHPATVRLRVKRLGEMLRERGMV